MRTTPILLATTLLASLAAAPATGPATAAADVAALEARVRSLEAENAQLRERLGIAERTVQPAAYVAVRDQARQRMLADRSTFSARELAEIEKLYQDARDARGTASGRASLEKLIVRYPKSNRAGCATLDLAEAADGDARERLLCDAIDAHGDAFYGDGCQVGPYAMFHLARHYADAGATDKANAIRDTLRTKHPTAIDHAQQLLVSQLGG